MMISYGMLGLGDEFTMDLKEIKEMTLTDNLVTAPGDDFPHVMLSGTVSIRCLSLSLLSYFSRLLRNPRIVCSHLK